MGISEHLVFVPIGLGDATGCSSIAARDFTLGEPGVHPDLGPSPVCLGTPSGF